MHCARCASSANSTRWLRLVVRPSHPTCNGARAYATRRVSTPSHALGSGSSDRPSRVPRFRAGVHAQKGPQGRMPDGSAPFAVVAGMLLVCTRRRHSPADVPPSRCPCRLQVAGAAWAHGVGHLVGFRNPAAWTSV